MKKMYLVVSCMSYVWQPSVCPNRGTWSSPTTKTVPSPTALFSKTEPSPIEAKIGNNSKMKAYCGKCYKVKRVWNLILHLICQFHVKYIKRCWQILWFFTQIISPKCRRKNFVIFMLNEYTHYKIQF